MLRLIISKFAAHCIARPEFKDWRPAWRSFEPEMKAILRGGGGERGSWRAGEPGKASVETTAEEAEGNVEAGGRASAIFERAQSAEDFINSM